MPPAELSKAVYRAVLRWAQAAEGVPFTLRGRDVQAVLPTLGAQRLDLDDSAAVRRLLRSGFSCHRELQDEQEASEALECGLRGLRLLNGFYLEHVQQLRREREVHRDRAGVQFHVGQVLRHRKYDYRGVICGWDARCAREPGWAEALRLDPDQPFYSVLTDEGDCQRAFGTVRFTKYVAQENVRLLPAPQRITNRALERYFSGYSPGSSRYVPNRQLAFQYPDYYDTEDVVSCGEDTNVLRLGDESGGEEPRHLEERAAEERS